MPKHSESKPGLLPDRLVAEQRYHVVVRTLERWDRTPGSGSPDRPDPHQRQALSQCYRA